MPRGTKVRATGSHTDHFICECGYTAISKTGIRLHRRVAHDDADLKDLNRDADNFQCKICKKIFSNKSQLLTHIRHTGHFKQ